MGTNNQTNPAVAVAKERSDTSGVLILDNGVKVRIRPVSAALISEVSARIKDPDPPTVYIKDKEREEPNPSDPGYLRTLEENNQKRGMAVIDAMVMFGVELIDGVPEDGEWVRKLKFMEKRGMLDLSNYDMGDPYEVEFLYKRFVIVDNTVVNEISRASGLSSEDVERARESFRRR